MVRNFAPSPGWSQQWTGLYFAQFSPPIFRTPHSLFLLCDTTMPILPTISVGDANQHPAGASNAMGDDWLVCAGTITGTDASAADDSVTGFQNSSSTEPAGGSSDALPFYKDNNLQFKVLIAMTYGIHGDDGLPILDRENLPPWLKDGNVRDWKPTQPILAREIHRRLVAYSWMEHFTTQPRPNLSKTSRCVEWLDEHPPTWMNNGINDCKLDVSFITQEMACKCMKYLAAASSKAEQENDLEGKRVGCISMLRLIHTLVEDDESRSGYV